MKDKPGNYESVSLAVSLVEWILILVLVAVVVIIIVALLGDKLPILWAQVQNFFQSLK